MKVHRNVYMIGYRHPDIDTYTQDVTLLSKGIGYILIGVGVVTLPFPTGSLILIGMGLLLIGLSERKLIKGVKNWVRFVKWKVGL